MKEKIVRARIGTNSNFYFRCVFKVKVGDIVIVEDNDKNQINALIEEVNLISKDKINFDLEIFNSVLKVVGPNEKLKIFSQPTYPKVKIDKKIKKLWVQDDEFLGYKFKALHKFANYSYTESDSKISVWGNKSSGEIVARVGDVFDDNFIEEMFSYNNPARFTYLLNNIKLHFHRYINNEITLKELENILEKIRNI